MLPVFRLFMPRVYLENISSINIKKLKEKKNIKGIIVDLENTIVPKGTKYLDEQITSWVDQVKRNGLKICLLSNTHNNFKDIAAKLDIPFLYSRYKPMKRPFLQAMEIMGTSNRETAVIGDQLCTDVFGGNRLQLFTILIQPLSQKDAIGTTIFNRLIEKILISHWQKNGKMRLEKGMWPN